MFRILFIFVIAAGLATAQQAVTKPAASVPQTDPPETKPEDRCGLEGKVVNAATGAPVKKANIRLYPMTGGPSMTARTSFTSQTDAEGKFSMKDIDPGSYSLSVNRVGYVNQQYGAKRPNRGGTPLALKPAQKMTDLEIRLTPHSLILGKVIDEDGDPVPNVQVAALRYSYMQGRKQLMPTGYAQTNDLGEYRMFGVAPGKYLISATYRDWSQQDTVDRSAAAQKSEESYAPTYFPGTTELNSASQVEVAPASEARGMDIRLRKSHSVRIKGKVIFPSGASRNANVQLIPRGAQTVANFGMDAMAQVREKGAFELRGVMPGAYFVQARIFDGKQMVTRQAVDVGATDLENVELRFGGSGVDIPGSVTVLGEGGKALSNLHISLRPEGTMYYAAPPSAGVKEDLTFTLTDATPDQYYLWVAGLEDNAYVKSVKWADQEVEDQKVDLTKGATGKLEVIISRNGGQLEGTVNNEKESKLAPGVTVVLVPEMGKRDRAFLFKMASTDQNGHFQIKAIPPGEYKVFAWEDIEFGAYQDPDYLKPYENKGEPVSVKESGSSSVQLKMIPVESGS